ncbi:MAG: ABC transporter permease [Lachnospiraceae bacterium]|nr:ABC transporter permease [Lachnospiraceae bacterium]
MLKYVIKRIVLMFVTLFIIVTMCFFLIKLLPQEYPQEAAQKEAMMARLEAQGYNKPLIVQYIRYLKNIFTKWDFGTSWKIDKMKPVWQVFTDRFPPTILINLYSMLLATPIGILLGIYAAIKKNKWQDQLISTSVMIFVSVPSYVYGFLVQYYLYFKWDLLPLTVYSLADAGGSWFTWKMFVSMLAPVIALSFGTIAQLCRFTRAELTETLTSDYMLLARTKGLTRSQATARHAMKNAMVPILPMLLGSVVDILAGSFVIEQIFSVPGVGQLYLNSITLLDYDVFMMDTVFYTFIGLAAGIVTDISYGFIDPRIRMGER